MFRRFLMALVALTICTAAQAQTTLDEVVQISVLDGGPTKDGRHMAALRVTLKEGWKTYWRAPGDAGIPPRFSWTGSRNVDGVEIVWPAPTVFDQNGYRSVGYIGQLVLPLLLDPAKPGAPLRLKGEIDFGVCKDVCVAARLPFSQDLDLTAGRNPTIAAAMAQRPFSAREAGVRSATCSVRPTQDGMQVETRIDLPRAKGEEVVILEPGNPLLWASEMNSRRKDGALVSVGEVIHSEGRSFALNRSDMRITVLSNGQAVEINGCTAG